MVIGKIKPAATIVAQFPAGVEINVIQHEGNLYLPVMNLGEFAPTESTPPKKVEATTVAEKRESAESKPEVKSTQKSDSFTLDELMDKDSKELLKILKNTFGVDPDDFEGKNTHKKLRDLVLNAQVGNLKTEPEKEESTESAEDEDEDESLVEEVSSILEDFDAGSKNKKKTIAALVALSTTDDLDEDEVASAVEEFEGNGSADLEATAQQIANILMGKKPVKKENAKKKISKDKDLVDAEDLKVGDRVSVYWNDDNKDWFEGEVSSIKKGKIMIDYDDDSQEVIDPEVHTKIKLLTK